MRNGQVTGFVLLLTLLVAAVGAACGSQQASSRAEGKIALLDDSGSLAIVDADGSSKAVIVPTNDAVPVWAPDGSHIAFDDAYELATVKADGSGYAPLLSEGGSSALWTWSGDSDKIAYVGADPHYSWYYHAAIFVVPAAGGKPRMLVDGDSPSWSPDGRTIAFIRGPFIRLINADGTRERRLATDSLTIKDEAYLDLLWSSDSQKIAYTTSFSKDGKEFCRLHIAHPDGRPEVQVIGGGLPGKEFDTQCDIAWSPEGTRTAFTRNGFIYSVNADGTHEHRLARGLEQSWSPDGKHIAYLRKGSIYALDMQSHVEHRLVRGDEFSWWPDGVWSPDGAFLVVQRVIKQRVNGRNGKYVVETMRPDGSDRRVIWPQGGGTCDCGDTPAWQPR